MPADDGTKADAPRTLTGAEAERRSRMLFLRWRNDGDQAAREQLIVAYTPLSRKLARRYRNTSEPWEDLCQVAQVGLVKAVDGFDPDRGFPFTAFAVPTILGELRRYFRGATWAVRVPRGLQERALAFRDAERAFGDDQGRAPTIPEIAQFMEISLEEALEACQALRALGSVSLDAPTTSEDSDEAPSHADSLGREDPRYELVEKAADLSAALGVLDERKRRILHMRFFEELTQREIAGRVGVSQMQVSRLLAQTVGELRERAQPVA
jgi:RNA polymerase sigma-B factor